MNCDISGKRRFHEIERDEHVILRDRKLPEHSNAIPIGMSAA